MKQEKHIWRWTEGKVNTTEEHIKIYYGNAPHLDWTHLPIIALLSPPIEKKFIVEFLLDAKTPEEQDMIREVHRELDFYLVEKGEENPWAYARYHCGTVANIHSRVHWDFYPKGWRIPQKEVTVMEKEHKKLVNSTISIRPANPRDKARMLSVIGSYGNKWDRNSAKVYYDDYFSASANLKGDSVHVAVLDKEIIGMTGYFIDRYEVGNYWLGWFYIHKKYSQKGYGTQLLNFIIAKLKKKRIKRLFVNTSSYPFYREALNFYLKNGFRIEAVIKNYYWNGEDQIILSKQL
jgi:GNAT superfamily N-acetyltransferase